MLVDAGGKADFRVGTRVPYPTAANQNGGPTNFQYADVGVNIDCFVRETSGKVSLSAQIEISSVVKPAQAAVSLAPTISNVRAGISTVIPTDKPTLVASIEDPVTMRKFDVEALVHKAP